MGLGTRLRNTQNRYYLDKDTTDEQCLKKEHMYAYINQKNRKVRRRGRLSSIGKIKSRNLNTVISSSRGWGVGGAIGLAEDW
jgi:hypothetical protein